MAIQIAMRALALLLIASSPAQDAPSGNPPETIDETTSTLKFTLPEHDLYPESIAYDPVSGCYYLGSMSTSRILRIHEDGTYEDFLAKQDTGC
jgi:hypothetical protein